MGRDGWDAIKHRHDTLHTCCLTCHPQEKHAEQWAVGQQKMTDRLATEAAFRTTQAHLNEMRTSTKQHAQAHDVHDKIDAFESNLERIGVDMGTSHDVTTSVGITGVDGDDVTPQAHVAQLSRTLPTQAEQHHTATTTLAAIHGKTVSDAAASKEREHRRRKVMVDQVMRHAQARHACKSCIVTCFVAHTCTYMHGTYMHGSDTCGGGGRGGEEEAGVVGEGDETESTGEVSAWACAGACIA